MKLLTFTAFAALIGSASAACDTTFLYPAGTRTYESNDLSSGLTMQMTQETVNSGETTTIRQTLSLLGMPIKNNLTVRCDGDMLRLDGDLGKFSLANALPTKDKWAPGYTWTSTANLPANIMTTTTYKIVGTEKVTTPAGNFDAFRVESESISSAQPGKSLPFWMKNPKPTQTTYWYAPGQGLIKYSMYNEGKPYQDTMLIKLN